MKLPWAQKSAHEAPKMLAQLVNDVGQLTCELGRLGARLGALEKQASAPVGLACASLRESVSVGGQPVEIYPLPAEAWVKATGELPAFLLSYAITREAGSEFSGEELAEFVEAVKSWLRQSVQGEVDLARLSVPEAMHAGEVIVRLNGIDEKLAAWFRARLAVKGSRPGGQEVRRAPQHAAGAA